MKTLIKEIIKENRNRYQKELLIEYKKYCNTNKKEISWTDFIDNFVWEFLLLWWQIKL